MNTPAAARPTRRTTRRSRASPVNALNRSVRFRISANALKTVDHRGGLDAFLAKAKESELSPKALDIKRQLEKKLAQAS